MANEMKVSEKTVTALDNLVAQGCELTNRTVETFAQTMQLASLARQAEALLNAEVMAELMWLRGKPFGWKSDKEYSMDVYRDVMIAAFVNGAMPANNEILVIGGNFYAQKNFFRRRLRKLDGFTDMQLLPGKVAVMPGGATVEMSARWNYNAKPMKMERVGTSAIPVRLNNGQGADAAIGKAERKIMAAIFNQLTGSEVSDADPDETDGFSGTTIKVEAQVVDEKPAMTRTEEVKQALQRARPDAAKQAEATSTTAPQAETKPATTEPPAPTAPTTTTAPAGEVPPAAAKKTRTKTVGHTRTGLTGEFQPVTKEVPAEDAAPKAAEPPKEAPAVDNNPVVPTPATADPAPMSTFAQQQLALTGEVTADVIVIASMLANVYSKDVATGKENKRIKVIAEDAREYYIYDVAEATKIKGVWSKEKSQKFAFDWRANSAGDQVVVGWGKAPAATEPTEDVDFGDEEEPGS